LPCKITVIGDRIEVSYKDYKVINYMNTPNSISKNKDFLVEREVKSALRELNRMMFGVENYASKNCVIPKQLRNSVGIKYTLYFERIGDGKIIKYDVFYVVSTVNGLKVLLQNGNVEKIYDTLIFIEPKHNGQ
jgi:hypothetical protein